MLWKCKTGLACTALVLGLLTSLPTSQGAEQPKTPAVVQIGLVNSLFRDVPEALVDMMAKPFGSLMSAQTGLTGNLVKAGDAADLGQKLADNKVQLGIFHGYEFAWARHKHPQLKALVIAVNQVRHLRAYLVVRADSKLGGFGDLKEKTLNLPRGSRGHCHVFLADRCQDAGQCAPQEMLGKVIYGPNAEDALDDLVDGAVDACVMDSMAVDAYKRRKPGRFNQLKLALESEVFPAGVVAYKEGSLDAKTLQKFKDGLINSDKTILGRQMLTMWKLTGFEPIPADYDQTLGDILSAYPPPGE